MRTLLLSGIIVGLTTFAAFAEPEIKGSPTELAQYLDGVPKTVSINGESELKVPADRALISLKVVTENRSLQDASRLNQEARTKIINTLKERGLPADRIQPSKFSSTPKYGIFGEKAKSYRVENIVKISAQDEKEFQAVASLVDTMSEVRYDSIEFEHSDKDALKTKALSQAIDKAAAKKRLYEEKLGVKLTPKDFTEMITMPAPNIQSIGYNEGKAYPLPQSTSPSSRGPQVDTIDQSPTSFGELIFTAQVTIQYSLTTK